MAEGVELALGAMMFYGLADWVYKRAAQSGVQAHHFLALQAFFFAPGIFLYGLTTGTLVLGVPFAWGMTAGVLIFVALYNFARSLASGAVSIVAPVFRLSFAITSDDTRRFFMASCRAGSLSRKNAGSSIAPP